MRTSQGHGSSRNIPVPGKQGWGWVPTPKADPQKQSNQYCISGIHLQYARGWEGEVHCEPAKRRGLSCPGHSEAFTWGSRRWIEVQTGKRGAKRERWVSGVARLGGGYGGGGEGSTGCLWPKVKLVTGEWDREGNIHGVTDRANQKFQTERSSEHRSEGGSGSMPRAGQSWRCLGRCLGRPDSPSLSLSQGLNCDMA